MHLSQKQFDALVQSAIDTLPQPFAQWLDQVPIIVEDFPTPADNDPHDDPPLGMYIGPSRADSPDTDLPPRIMLYRQPLLDACRDHAQLAEEIRKTLLHELGHHAGMSEDQLTQLGYGPLEDNDILWDTED